MGKMRIIMKMMVFIALLCWKRIVTFSKAGRFEQKSVLQIMRKKQQKRRLTQFPLDVLDQIQLICVQVENKQKQMDVLALRKETTARTKELYQEQYKLGTRTVVDLLNSEQSDSCCRTGN